MKVYLAPSGRESFRPVPGPPDLMGKGGTVRIIPEPSDTPETRVSWAAALGLFALRGGAIEGRRTP